MPGGRPEGSMSKNKKFLMTRLQDMYGKDFHPIMQMAKNASTLQKIADDHAEGKITMEKDDKDNIVITDATTSAINANQAWDKIAPYTEPKLTAHSVDTKITAHIDHSDMTEEALDRRVQELNREHERSLED